MTDGNLIYSFENLDIGNKLITGDCEIEYLYSRKSFSFSIECIYLVGQGYDGTTALSCKSPLYRPIYEHLMANHKAEIEQEISQVKNIDLELDD